MKRFKNILYFVDNAREPEPALDRAVLLAKMNRAKLTVLDVLAHLDNPPEFLPHREVSVRDVILKRRQMELDYLVTPYQSDAAVIQTKVLTGAPFVEVIRQVINDGVDLLVKASRPPKGFYGSPLGSNDMHLLRKCPCPVWIEKPANTHPYRTILAAVDPATEHSQECDRLVMDLATSMSKNEGARLAVMHAWRVYGEASLDNPWFGYSSDELQALKENTRAHHENVLNQLVSPYGMSSKDHSVHLVKGDAAESILHIDHQLRTDLIVMGTVGRVDIPGYVIGNTAEEVLQNTRASILAVKPAGFVSPVQ